jgi:DNA-directed RNA polymerase specialized sigma24 family protein
MNKERLPSPAASSSNIFLYLDPDPRRAHEKYEDIRRRLHFFFECSYLPDAEELVQDVFLRAIQAVASGKQIYSVEPHSFFLAIARNVRFEQWKRRRCDQGVPEDIPVPHSGDGHARRIEDAIYIRELLEHACDSDRRVLQDNYEYGGGTTASGDPVPPPAWRVLVHRARKRMRGLASVRTNK